jgi:hypothetical protein
MTERPILFSSPMVRAILDGRKTQTRRVVKPQPTLALDIGASVGGAFIDRREVDAHGFSDVVVRCPYGVPGDQLWVRETWAAWTPPTEYGECDEVQGPPSEMRSENRHVGEADITYAADGDSCPDRWRPSIHMPRWASRITLDVVAVSVERLRDITEEDASREGIERFGGGWRDYAHDGEALITGPASFATLWDGINGAGSWAANPWVWRVEFRRTT